MKKNPFVILGLPSNSDSNLIKATYKALVKVYHPDSFKGDKDFANEKIKELNWSYGELKEEKNREFYASKLNDDNSDKDNEYASKEDNSVFEDALGGLWKDWEIAITYHEKLNGLFNDLKKIDTKPAVLFITILLETKDFDKANNLSDTLEDAFLRSRFGNNETIVLLAKFSLLNNHTKFAEELSQAVRVLGDDQYELILKKLFIKNMEIGEQFSVYIKNYDYISHIAAPEKFQKLKATFKANLSIEIVDLLREAGYSANYLDGNYCSISDEFGNHLATVKGTKDMLEVVQSELDKMFI